MKRVTLALIMLLVCNGWVYAQATWVSFTPSTPGAPPIIQVLASNNTSTIIHVTIPGMWVADTLVNNVSYQILRIPDHGTNYNLGEPQIPAIRELVAIPPTSNVNIAVNSSTPPLVMSGYMVYPCQATVPEGQLPGPFIINNALYAANTFYPNSTAEITAPAIWRDVRVVNPTVYPITFNPVTHQLNVCYDFYVTLNYSGTSNVNILPNGYPVGVGPQYAAMYSNLIINYNWLGLDEDERYNKYCYLIITTQAYYNAIQPFVFWKHKKGFETEVEVVPAGYPADSVKQIISQDYNERHTEWVLLVGEVSDIPLKVTSWGPSDYWYTLLDTLDLYPELAIGRFSPANDTNVTTMVNKTFAYERYPTRSWDIDEVLLVVCQDCSDSYSCKQSIRTAIMEPINFKVDTAYAYPADHHATNDTVKRYIQENGGVSVVNYRGHGDAPGWGFYPSYGWSSDSEYFWTSDVDSLNNYWAVDSAWLPLVFNFCCLTGQILQPECMIEAWTRSPNGGAAGALGATHLTYEEVSNPMDTILFLAMFSASTIKRIYYVGEAINYAKIWAVRNMPGGNTSHVLQTVYKQLWAGDPSLGVWTDSSGELASLTVRHPTSITTDSTAFTVLVEDGDQTVPDAYVCLYKQSDIYKRGWTDANGRITFYIDPISDGWLYVTVTNHHYPTNYYYNYRPYEGTCRVLWSPGSG